ncbi:hypothetical protein ACHAW6_008869 [Cyclotella cf. meneghiniana]
MSVYAGSELNKVIRCKQYSLPVITNILYKCSGYEFFIKLDISIQYYTFQLDEHSQDLYTITTPFGKDKDLRFSVGLQFYPEMAQSIMESVLSGINDMDAYIDDVGAFSPDWDQHVISLHNILCCMQENGFTMNPHKCEWAIKETDWLGYWLTLTGLTPWKKKIETILYMDCPQNA